MSDLISRQAAIQVLDNAAEYWNLAEPYHEGIRAGYRNSARLLLSLPSAQPERKKGEWIKHPEQKNIYGGKCIECSECGEKYVVQYIEDEKYCRNCGADMRGEQE